MIGAELLDQLDHALRFVRSHAGQRFVKQQHARLRGQAHRNFELALLAVRQGGRDALGTVFEARGGQSRLRPLVDLGIALGLAEHPQGVRRT